MTASDKAYGLFEKLYLIESPSGSCQMTVHEAKQCALITIDEILKTMPDIIYTGDHIGYDNPVFEYWREVKLEVEKIEL